MTAVVEAEAVEVTETEEAKAPGKKGRKPEVRDFTVWKETHESFANYVNERYPDVAITPGQVKAAFLLRGEWSNTPEALAEREQAKQANEAEKLAKAERKAQREAEKAKFAHETPDEKAARLEREKAQKAADRATKRAEELMAKAKELREKAEAALDEASDSDDAEAAFNEIVAEAEVADVPEFSEAAPAPRRNRNRKRPA